jgi:uncharacterized protein (TIGR03663 family)
MTRDDTRNTLGFLDRPLFSAFRINWQGVILLLIVLTLVFTRLWDLGNRSYSHDESTHAWESWKLITGQGYQHNPIYHGPFLYHVTAFVFALLGVNDATARLGAALFAVAVVLLVWPLRRWLGRAGALFAMLLLTISPTMMYRGRFIRHDIFVMLPAIVMMIGFFKYLEDRKERWLYIIAAALSLAFCGKAVGFVYGAIFGSFWVLYLVVQWVRTRQPIRDMPSFDLVVLLGTLALPMLSHVPAVALNSSPFEYGSGLFRPLPPGPIWLRARVVILTMLALSAVVGLWWKRRSWIIATGIFYAIFVSLHTTLFVNGPGVESGILGQLGYWLSQQPEARGGQPWYYFYFLLTLYEFLPWLLGGLGAVYYVVTRLRLRTRGVRATESDTAHSAEARPLLPFLLYWTLLTFAVWTWASEKMPWQNLHLVLPLGILGGWFLGKVWESTDWRKLVRQGAAHMLVWLPVAFFSLLVLLRTTLGKPGPFSGVALEQLQLTLRWLLALILFLIALAFMYRYGRKLGPSGWSRVLLAALLVVLAGATVRFALMATFINQNYATEFLVFAAAAPDTAFVTNELDEMSRRLVGSQELRIAYDNESQQPFFWYLRDREGVSFFTGDSGLPGDPDVVLIGPGNEGKVKSQLTGKYMRRDYRLIWWPDENVYRNLTPTKLWNDLKDPARLKYWWDILWFRKYPQSTTSWPLVHKFAMYVRRDLAAQLWASGSEVVGPGIVLPEDEYEKVRIQVAAVATWGSFGTAEGQFNHPKGIALGVQSDVYVVDSSNHRVQVFNADGRLLRQWGGQGNAPGLFQEPWGIAVDQEGNVYVADTWNHRIQKFDAQGGFLTQWGLFGDTAGALGATNVFYGPRGIAVDPEGNVLVSDTGNKRILKFTSEGQFIQQWGGEGSLDGQFREPVGLAVDGDGNVYVADTWNWRIQKFDRSLSFVAQWPVLGWEGEGVTNKPYLAVDSKGNVYATAPDYHQAVKFDGSGKVLAVWGQFGSDGNSFNMPSDITVDAQDNVYVLDSANHRVLKFAPLP